MFYSDPRNDRFHVNMDQVKTIKEHTEERDGKWRHFATFHFIDGSNVEVETTSSFGFQIPGPVIASPPGYFLVAAHKGELILKQPIVAWMSRLGGLAPITIEAHRLDLDPSILQPDGTVLYPYEETYPNIEAWLEDDARRRAEDKAAIEAAAAL